MENNGAANTERAIVLYNNQRTIKISSLYIDFTMYGPFPKLNNEAKDVAVLNHSECSPKSSQMTDLWMANALLELSKYRKTAAEPRRPKEPRYVSLRDLIKGKKKI